jgi:hypothetical protein
LGELRPTLKEPNSATVLNNWIAKAERDLGMAPSGRLDGLVRGDLESFIADLDSVLAQPWVRSGSSAAESKSSPRRRSWPNRAASSSP